MTFGERLRAARKHAGLKQNELAALSGLRQATISEAEGGQSGSSKYATVLARVCGVRAEWLAEGRGQMLVSAKERGWVIDHVKPLACGGADDPANMQWQTTVAATAKDKVERKGCGK